MSEFFTLNRPLILFLYGQAFFVMGLAIFLQSRRHSRLQLARDLRWLAAFGILHGLHEWGLVFIPIQATYLPVPYISLLRALHALLLAASYACLLMFGTVSLGEHWKRRRWLAAALLLVWLCIFWVSLQLIPTEEAWHDFTVIWARYLLGFPGALMAAYGLRYQALTRIAPLGVNNIYRMLRVAGVVLGIYAILGGLLVIPAPFFPANVLNRSTLENLLGIPVEVYRSVVGVVLAVSIIRALEIFEIELDRLIEQMEVERVESAQRNRIGQEIHDGAMQGIYSVSLILDAMQSNVRRGSVGAQRLDQARDVLTDVTADLRRYMVSLRAIVPDRPLAEALRQLADNPRFSSLLDVALNLEVEPDLPPAQAGNLLGIAQEALANAARHAEARHVRMVLSHDSSGIVFHIEDDGKGFDETAITPGFGLRAMRDHARLLGGKLNIDSQRGKGTLITLRLPEKDML
jgi:signal transduction histidine kinase